MPGQVVTQERLKSVLHYEPDSGRWTWLVRLGVRNGRGYVGTEAGTIKCHGYRTICLDQKEYYCHRLAFLYMTGEMPSNEVDHIDGDRQNNRWNNLRPATRTQNLHNTRIRSDSSSRLKGAHFHKPSGKWMAAICVNKKSIHLGYFNTAQEAHEAYIRAANENFGEYARTG